MSTNKMVNLNHLSSVSRIFKKTWNNCFLKSGFSNLAIECTGPMKFGNKIGTLAGIPNLLKLPSNATCNISSILCNSHKLLINNSSSRNMSTMDNYTSTTDAVDEKKRLVEIEIELLRDEGHLEIPSTFSAEEWQELVELGPAGRQRFLRHLFIVELKKIKRHGESEQVHEMMEDRRKQVEKELLESEKTGLPSYGLWRNSIFMKWEDKRMNYIRANGVITAALHGQHIVFDNSFDYCMTSREKKDLSKQFGIAINSNREHADPFYFHLCNFNLKKELSLKMARYIPTLLDKSYPIEIHEESYLDHFPRDRLVYISPSAREDMTYFDHSAIYIIGNLIRQASNSQVEVAKVKKEGIKMQRLPLDKYLDWGTGTKSLPVNIILAILLDFRHTGSWVKAFDRNIPKRKLYKQDVSETDQIEKAMSKPHYNKRRLNSDSKSWFK